MTKLILKLTPVCLFLYSCSQKPETPESTAKLFIHDYFFAEDRSRILMHVTETAQVKIISENEYFKELKNQKSEIERPSFFSLIDSISINLNLTQYTFSIHYQGNVTSNQNMVVILKRDNHIWKVSDYRFTHAGE